MRAILICAMLSACAQYPCTPRISLGKELVKIRVIDGSTDAGLSITAICHI